MKKSVLSSDYDHMLRHGTLRACRRSTKTLGAFFILQMSRGFVFKFVFVSAFLLIDRPNFLVSVWDIGNTILMRCFFAGNLPDYLFPGLTRPQLAISTHQRVGSAAHGVCVSMGFRHCIYSLLLSFLYLRQVAVWLLFEYGSCSVVVLSVHHSLIL